MTKKQFKIGNSDFKDIIETNGYFVDKTLLIKDFIDNGNKVLFFPRPRRFGKTLNLSMLKFFFDVNEKDTEKLFTGFKIWQAGERYTQEQGKYPVIFLSLKDIKVDNWNDCLEHFRQLISRLYKNYKYILQSEFLDEDDKKYFQSIVNRASRQTDLENSIKNLSDYLTKYHNQKTIILIDEYDTPVHAAYENKYYKDVISFMRNFLSAAFKDNSSLYKGVITGILHIAKESIFSGLNNVGVYSILKSGFSDKFGFTENDINEISNYFGLKNMPDNVKNWYNGYKFGNTKEIYNPWSIANYVANIEDNFRAYWVNTSSDGLIKSRIREQDADYIRQDIETLIKGGTIIKSINENIVFADLDTNKELLWSLLLYSGYLTIGKNIKGKLYELKIPNFELKTLFSDIIIEWLQVDLNIQTSFLYHATQNLVNNRIEQYAKDLRRLIGDTFSYYDTGKKPEFAYHSYILGLLAILNDEYIVKSNRESGKGRYDILLLPLDKTKYGIIIEIKTLEKDTAQEQIDNKLDEALNQIEHNEYYKELIDHKIEKHIELALVFAGKNVFLKSETKTNLTG